MKKILFIGNSFTYVNDLPAMVEKLANAAGYACEVQSLTRGGWYLNRYADERDEMGAALRALPAEKSGWDYIVLQDQSFNPAGNPDDFMAAVKKLGGIMTPGEKFVMYQTWAYRDGSAKLAATGMSYQALYEALRKSYRAGAEALDGLCAPVGDAFALSGRERPEIDLLNAEDDYHPSLAGTYLAACVFCETLFGLDAETLEGVEGLSGEEAAALRNAAKRAARG